MLQRSEFCEVRKKKASNPSGNEIMCSLSPSSKPWPPPFSFRREKEPPSERTSPRKQLFRYLGNLWQLSCARAILLPHLLGRIETALRKWRRLHVPFLVLKWWLVVMVIAAIVLFHTENYHPCCCCCCSMIILMMIMMMVLMVVLTISNTFRGATSNGENEMARLPPSSSSLRNEFLTQQP